MKYIARLDLNYKRLAVEIGGIKIDIGLVKAGSLPCNTMVDQGAHKVVS